MEDIKSTNDINLENFNIKEEDLPGVISGQFNNIVEIDKKIQISAQNCENAKKQADKMILAKTMNQKEAINSTQDAVRAIADSQTALAEAQKVLFENQQRMAEGMRYLLILGASSISMNRIVIAELQAKLKKASQEELSKKAREELIGVISLLKEQESAFSKQDRMDAEIKIHAEEIEEIRRVDEIQFENDKKHDQLIAENSFKNAEQDKRLQEGVRKNLEQDFEIKRQIKVDAEHDRQIKNVKFIAWCGVGLAVISMAISIINMLL